MNIDMLTERVREEEEGWIACVYHEKKESEGDRNSQRPRHVGVN